MWDLAAGLVLVVDLSLVSFCIGVGIERRCSPMVANSAGSAAVVIILLFAILLHGRIVLARFLPVSNVIVVSNVIPLCAGLLGGIVFGRRSIPGWRRTAVGTILAALAAYTVLCDLVGAPPAVGAPRYHRGFCVQTSRASCSACCAASLLREHGIEASEKEMIELCLTRERGTPPLGLYRGLKLKTRGTPWDVEVFRCSLEELRETNSWPVILLVRILAPPLPASIERTHTTWPSRVHHAIVVYGVTDDGKVILGDPADGRTQYSLQMLRRVWRGEGIRLVRGDRRTEPLSRAPHGEQERVAKRHPQHDRFFDALQTPLFPLDGNVEAVLLERLRPGDRPTLGIEHLDHDLAEVGLCVHVELFALELQRLGDDPADVE